MTRTPTSIAEPSRRTLFGLAAGAAVAPMLPAVAAITAGPASRTLLSDMFYSAGGVAASIPCKHEIVEAVAYARTLRQFCPTNLENMIVYQGFYDQVSKSARRLEPLVLEGEP